MNGKKRTSSRSLKFLGVIFSLLAFVSCATAQYNLVPAGTLPSTWINWDISESPVLAELNRTYGQGIKYEHAKIKYLLAHTALSPYSFDRNGHVYNSETTAKHLRKKFRQRLEKITTAQIFVDHIATTSSQSGRDYYALPGDGNAYRTGDILNHELSRLELFMKKHKG